MARRTSQLGIRKVLQADRTRAALLQGGRKALREAKKHHNKGNATDVAAGTGNSTATSTAAAAAGSAASDTNVAATNQGEDYVVSVGVGSPPTFYNLLVDTGSSNTWVGAGQAFVKTSTSKATGQQVEVSYGSGAFEGEEFTDNVQLGDLAITAQSIGVASQAEGFEDVDGIIGIGPTDLTIGTVGGQNSQTEVPTVTDNLFSQGIIGENLVSVFFAPPTSANDTNGELTFGSVDDSKTTGNVAFTPLTTTAPASEFWGIDQSITYGSSNTPILAQTAGIVDTGTTLILMATNAFDAYTQATGATQDQTTGLLTLSNEDFNNLQSLFFNIGDQSYELTANAQIWPRSLNSLIGGQNDQIYLVVSDIGTESGQGLDFINGFSFLERYLSVFDTANNQVGFAPTQFTNATTN
ncbi:aspartic proteinase [Fomitopsis schrenkii]|uniref:Aspartic proteinase n=1 Tax=Fomitopsis schrenkii TaxID=2126942 RepID=S8DXT8_FOMSC|nr:aspartic proteinase [Fomitopsis schrenkii]